MLLIGPPRCGKTTRVLKLLARAVRADRSDEVQLLVPTASMKHHLLNLLARRGPDGAVTGGSDDVRTGARNHP